MQGLHVSNSFFYLLGISKAEGRKRDYISPVFQTGKFFKNTVNRMIVIRRKQHGFLIKKGSYDRIDYGIRLAGSRRSLNIGNRIFHGVINCQKLIQIDILINQCNGISLYPHRPTH